jgi:putative heme-binding domain-containing protein
MTVRVGLLSGPRAGAFDCAAAPFAEKTTAKTSRYTFDSMRITPLIISAAVLGGAISISAAQTPDRAARQATLTAAPGGNKALGKPIFEKVCANCHKFGTVGKEIGPELTAIAATRKRPEIIESMLFPSKIIADQYKPDLIQTKDGDIVSGLVIKENARAVTIVTSDHPEKPVEVLKSQIQARKKSSVSAMPEGLLDTYTNEQVLGLIAFLLAGPGGY